MLAIDPMHVFLGTGKHNYDLFIAWASVVNKRNVSVQQFIDNLTVPSDIGWIPQKLNLVSGFKADQYKKWIKIHSIPALFHSALFHYYQMSI